MKKVFVCLFLFVCFSSAQAQLVDSLSCGDFSVVKGNKVPDFMAYDQDSVFQSLHDVKVKKCLLVFYSPSCVHCQESMETLETLQEIYRYKQMQVVVLAVDSLVNTYQLKKISKHPLLKVWGLSSYAAFQLMDCYRVSTFPAFYLLDKKKRLISVPIDREVLLEVMNRHMSF